MPCLCPNPAIAGFRPAPLPFPFAVPTQFILVINIRDVDDAVSSSTAVAGASADGLDDQVGTQHIAVCFLNGCAVPTRVSCATARQLVCDGCPVITLPLPTL